MNKKLKITEYEQNILRIQRLAIKRTKDNLLNASMEYSRALNNYHAYLNELKLKESKED